MFSTFKDTLKELSSKISDLDFSLNTGDTPDSIIAQHTQDFQNSNTPKVFLGTWQKCGTGITLNKATYLIFIDTPWTYASYEQACDRIHRIGTNKSVTIYNLITDGTVDAKVKTILESKETMGEYIVDNELNEQNIEILKQYIKELVL